MSGLFASPDRPRDDAASADEAVAAASAVATEPRPGADDGVLAERAPIDADAAFAAPKLDGSEPIDYIVPTPPLLPTPPPSRARAVAWLGVGALLLGAAGGVGGAAAWDAWGPNSDAVTLPISRPAGDITPAAGTVAAVAQEVLPSVVQIQSLNGGVGTSTGSGIVIREDGYLLTNNHVVESSDGEVSVLFSDGSVESGKVVGASPEYDIAVIKVDSTDLVPLALGDSDALLVGDPVIAIGSPLGLDATVTTGIVSALGRPVTTGDSDAAAHIAAIQTDAAINPGNSGGPLLNMAGEVIGINSAVAALPGATSATGAGSVGLGFAIPSNQVRRVAEELIATGKATVPAIGVLLDTRYDDGGVRVLTSAEAEGRDCVVDGSPADLAGIKEGDIIVAIDGTPVADPDTALVRLRSKAPGDEATLTLKRDGEEQTVTLTLVALDSFEPDPAAP